MLKTISRVGKEVWSDIIFNIVIHLLLLSLYAFVYFSSHLPVTSKARFPSTNKNILGVCV